MNIKIYPKTGKMFNFPFLVKTPEAIIRVIETIVGDKEAPNGVPYYQEVEGWADLAVIGEVYETEDFKAICVGDHVL